MAPVRRFRPCPNTEEPALAGCSGCMLLRFSRYAEGARKALECLNEEAALFELDGCARFFQLGFAIFRRVFADLFQHRGWGGFYQLLRLF